MPIVIELPHEFEARHVVDGPKLPEPHTSCWIFPDGAVIDSLGNRIEPPVLPDELLRAKRRYVALNLLLEEEAWNQFKGDCADRLSNKARYANPLPGPPSDAKEQLERGAKRIQKLRNQLAVLDWKISKLPAEVARRQQLELQRANQQTARQQLNDIVGVTI